MKRIFFKKIFHIMNFIFLRLDPKQQVKFAIYMAEEVLKNYETVLPEDTRPRQAIEAAKWCLISKHKKAAGMVAFEKAKEAYKAWHRIDDEVPLFARYAAHSASMAAFAAAYLSSDASFYSDKKMMFPNVEESGFCAIFSAFNSGTVKRYRLFVWEAK